MELQHINIKLFVDGDLRIDPARFIEVFHKWIQEGALDELLIDVADYRHVPNGPGVLLVAHEADYSMDYTGGRWGLRYNRKARVEGSNTGRLTHALRAATCAGALLEKHFAEEGPLKFSRHEFELFINDRALAPNTTATFQAARPDLEAGLVNILGHREFTLAHDGRDPRRRFSVTVRLTSPFNLAALAMNNPGQSPAA